MDNLDTAMLENMEVGDLAGLDVETLDALYWKVNDELTTAKRREGRLHNALEARYAAKASEALLADGRDTGTVRFTDGTYQVAVTRPKRVKWDQVALRTALDTLDPSIAAHFAKVEIKIDERKFDAATPDIREALAAARTVETGKAKYDLTRKEAA